MGTGKKTHVTDDNRLDVTSKTCSRIYYNSRDIKMAFAINLSLTQASGGATENLGYIKYVGFQNLYIHDITLSTEEPGTGLTKFGVWLGCACSGGTSKIPTNLNQTSTLTSNASCYHNNDGVGPLVSLSGGSSIQTVRMTSIKSYFLNLQNAIILGNNNVVAIKTNAATTGTKIRATITFFEE